MTQATSGKILRETRERKGYDLTTVARRLRIRPDILKAIEAGDFSAMPPRGYARNMVNAYARLLGLNPTEIVNMYLDEAYSAQIERARESAPMSGFNMERDSMLGMPRSRSGSAGRGAASPQSSGRIQAGGTGRYSRVLYDDRTQYSRDDYGLTRERTARPGKSDRDFLSHHSGYSSSGYGASQQGFGGRAVQVGQTPMQYSASRLPAFLQTKAVLIAAVAVVVVVIILVLAMVLGHRDDVASNDVSQLPVSGINDTTGQEDDKDATAQVEVAPSSSHVVLSVKEGDECYLEVLKGEDITPYSMTGPAEETIEVTDQIIIATWTPEYVTVKVDNEEVQLTENSDYGGMYTYTVDFPAILEKWRSTHSSSEAQRSSAVAAAENASGDNSAE